MLTLPLTQSDKARFWAKVDRRGPDECWPWTAAIVRKYGTFHLVVCGRQRSVKAHRVAYEQVMGEIPDGAPIDHICHMERCVNPKHLRPVTAKQNAENRNRANSNSKSGVRGVQPRKNGWRAVIGHNGRHYESKTFPTVEEADAAAQEIRQRLFTHSAG